MSRPRLELVPDSCYHVTTRCNNREFHLTQPLCRNLLLYALSQAIKEYGFKLYALCLMSNHVHYYPGNKEGHIPTRSASEGPMKSSESRRGSPLDD